MACGVYVETCKACGLGFVADLPVFCTREGQHVHLDCTASESGTLTSPREKK